MLQEDIVLSPLYFVFSSGSFSSSPPELSFKGDFNPRLQHCGRDDANFIVDLNMLKRKNNLLPKDTLNFLFVYI